MNCTKTYRKLALLTYCLLGSLWSPGQEYSMAELIRCRDVALSYCEYMQSLSYGDVSRKVLIEDLWETTSNKMPNDIMIGGGRTELRNYLINLQNNKIHLDYPDNPILDESYFQNGPETLFIFHTHKTLFDQDVQEYIIISGETRRIKNIYRDLPDGLVPRAIEQFSAAESEIDDESDDGELVILTPATTQEAEPTVSDNSDLAGNEQSGPRVLSGRVTDPGGDGLPGCNVVLKGTTTGTTSDLDGNYRLTIPEEGGTAVFSFIGYQTLEVNISTRSVIDVQMGKKKRRFGF